MTTVREGWVVFDSNGYQMTGPHVIEYYAWCRAGYTMRESVEHAKKNGYTCEYVEVTIRKKEPTVK